MTTNNNVEDSVETGQQWICAFCCTWNAVGSDDCAECGKPKPAAVPQMQVAPTAEVPDQALDRYHGNQVVFLVWTGLRGKPETHQLRSVDTTRKTASAHLSMCDTEADMRDMPSRTWIEERECDHLYGYEIWQALAHAERLRPTQSGSPANAGTSQPTPPEGNNSPSPSQEVAELREALRNMVDALDRDPPLWSDDGWVIVDEARAALLSKYPEVKR